MNNCKACLEISLWDVKVMMYSWMDLSIQIGKIVQMTEEVLLGYVYVLSFPWYHGLEGNISLFHSALQKQSILQLVMNVWKQCGYVRWFLDYLIKWWIQPWYILINRVVWSYEGTRCSMIGWITLISSIIFSVIKSRGDKWFFSISPLMRI